MESTVMAESLVIGLSKIAPGDGDRVGRKAANLAVLLQAGFPVPDGAVLTTGLTAAASQPEIDQAVGDVLGIVGDGPLAVRSSATSRLVDDQVVTVDGTTGIVEPVGS